MANNTFEANVEAKDPIAKATAEATPNADTYGIPSLQLNLLAVLLSLKL